MLLSTIFAPLWHPLRDNLSLFRALASGGRIPGTNLILMPATPANSRFGIIEHTMMALAGAWLLFRVICCELADEDKEPEPARRKSSRRHLPSSSNAPEETEQLKHIEETNCEQEEEMFYWESQGHQPSRRFTRNQLDAMLHVEQDEFYAYNSDYDESVHYVSELEDSTAYMQEDSDTG